MNELLHGLEFSRDQQLALKRIASGWRVSYTEYGSGCHYMLYHKELRHVEFHTRDECLRRYLKYSEPVIISHAVA